MSDVEGFEVVQHDEVPVQSSSPSPAPAPAAEEPVAEAPAKDAAAATVPVKKTATATGGVRRPVAPGTKPTTATTSTTRASGLTKPPTRPPVPSTIRRPTTASSTATHRSRPSVSASEDETKKPATSALRRTSHQQEICARFTTCEQTSLANLLEGERKRPEVSFIATPAASWVDDFFFWLNPDLGDQCCVENGKACFADRDPEWDITLHGMPEGDEFVYYLEKFLTSPTNADCPLGGQAAYSDAVVIDKKRETIAASHFRAMHTPLRSQDDFIHAMSAARRIASEIKKETGVEVFPYSLFYIFFDQYATIVSLAGKLLGSAVAIIFVITTILLGSPLTALVVTITVCMTVVDIIGAMAVFDVSLNAVSLVNLIICVGIGVEFCAHIARAFMFPSRTVMERAKNRFRGRDARAWTALVNVGASVFSGITVTKLLG
ncbi:hypothetical protein BN1723_016413, partial [Verticillium longisporum]